MKQCREHPHRKAAYFCHTCKAPLCKDCAEEPKEGIYTCFQCGMQQSVSEVGHSLTEKQEKAVGKKSRKEKKWGPFNLFLTASSVLIVVMWGVIIFGGYPAPAGAAKFVKDGRVLQFIVDSALKRYAHYEGDTYPEELSDLVPRYMYLEESEIFNLEGLSYKRDPEKGYRLSLRNPKKGETNVIISSKGIEYVSSAIGEIK